MIRLFVAIDLPDEIRLRLAALCAGVPGAKWVRAENLHLTLRFIGEVDEAMAADIDESLARIRAPGFALMVTDLGHFGSRGRARVLWAGIETSPALRHLHDKIEAALVRTGLEPEGRKFTPHITLARLKDARLPRISAFLAGNGPFRAGPFAVDRFRLYSSHLARDGAIHTVEADYELMGGEGARDEA